MNRRCAGVLLMVAAFSSGAFAQSVNVDFGTDGGVPSDTFAGAGLAGRWNSFFSFPSEPIPLLGLDGNPTKATFDAGFGTETIAIDDPAITGDEGPLMEDFLVGTADAVRHLIFAGLENGLYQIVTYGWTPTQPGELTAVWVEAHGGRYQVCGGEWPGGLVHGITHAIHHANVIDGELVMSTAAGQFGTNGNLNGIQLVRLGPVCLSDWNHDGVSSSQDFFDFLANFFDGFADFNRDEVTDSRDFFDFLGAFFAGCD